MRGRERERTGEYSAISINLEFSFATSNLSLPHTPSSFPDIIDNSYLFPLSLLTFILQSSTSSTTLVSSAHSPLSTQPSNSLPHKSLHLSYPLIPSFHFLFLLNPSSLPIPIIFLCPFPSYHTHLLFPFSLLS